MKTEASVQAVAPVFEPIKLTITIESAVEKMALVSLFQLDATVPEYLNRGGFLPRDRARILSRCMTDIYSAISGVK